MSKDTGYFTDEELVEMICGQAADRDQALRYIFVRSGLRDQALSRLQRQGAGLHDAKDAVQEAMIALDKQVRSGGFDRAK